MRSAKNNLAAVLEARARAGGWSGEAAFIAGDRCVTHGDVHDGAARSATVLAKRGVVPGDRVLIVLPDGLEFVWAFLGAARLGAVAVPVNPRLTPLDHAVLGADADPRVVVCPEELADRFRGRTVVLPETLGVTVTAGMAPAPAAPVEPGDPAYAQYTSGTTGAPKCAVHAHGHPLVFAEAFAGPAVALDRRDVVLSVSKLYFAYGLGNALFFPLLTGCRAVLHAAHPTPASVADLVRKHRVTVLYAVPTFFAHLISTLREDDLPSVRVAVSAGEPLTAALAQRIRAVLGCPVLDGLGSTEVGQTFASNTLDCWHDGTVGRALPPYRVSVRGEDGGPLGPGDVGDLWVAGPTLPLGHAGEWLATGDRAEIDARGLVRLHGRADDIELVGGMCVAPGEVEAVLARHPAVTEVAVAGFIEADGASCLRAYVVATAGHGAVAHPNLAADLLDAARAALAPYKVPRTVTFVSGLPRTPTGKLRRFVLRSGDWPKALPDAQASTVASTSVGVSPKSSSE